MKIGVVGLGKLGLPMAAVFSSRGHQVVGVDVDAAVIEKVNRNGPNIEPEVNGLLAHYPIRATTDYAETQGAELIFVVVPTPSLPGGKFSIEYVLQTSAEIGQINSKNLVVVLTSTVCPGSCIEIVSILERHIGRNHGDDWAFCYNPVFIALGSVVRDLRSPDFVLIGSDSGWAADALENFWSGITNGAKAKKVNLVNAEIAKLALNSFVTMKMTFANELAQLCERIPAAHVDQVTETIGLDHRIGRHYFKGAVAWGGPCFPRDNDALGAVANEIGTGFDLASLVHRLNIFHRWRLHKLVARVLPRDATLGILGLAYKSGTDVVEESMGQFLLNLYPDSAAYDSLVTKDVALSDVVDAAAVLVLTLPCEEFKSIQPRMGQVVIDCWRILDGRAVRAAGARYIPLGVYSEEHHR